MEAARAVRLFGARRDWTFREAATKFLSENTHKRSLERDARALAGLDPYIGELPGRRIYHDTLQPYVRARLQSGISPGTINRDLAVVRRILNLAARLWRDEADRPWLATAPLIQMQQHPDKREPYPLSIDEERLLFSELNGHLASMALFKVNTGIREQEVVNLSWQWEVQVPELDSSIFVVPRRFVKNGLDRYVVLNRVARSVIESCRGKHPERVFTRNGRPITKIYNSGWKGARRRASERYAKELGRPCPRGFDPCGYMTSSTPLVIGSERPASGSRIAKYYLATSPITSPRTTRHPKSALSSPLRSGCASWGHAKVTRCL
jgi:integrase